jgi:hypothetical protein
METTEIKNQLTVKRTELNLIQDPEKRKKLETDIIILNHKLSIERIKELIHAMQQT